ARAGTQDCCSRPGTELCSNSEMKPARRKTAVSRPGEQAAVKRGASECQSVERGALVRRSDALTLYAPLPPHAPRTRCRRSLHRHNQGNYEKSIDSGRRQEERG